MHYHLEIIMPPTDDIEGAVTRALEKYDENFRESEDDGGERNPHAFWDFWVIGGRWSGAKLKAQYSEESMDAFYAELTEKGVTVSGLRAGKQRLQPESQIPVVDAMWRKHFPDGGEVCPLFSHFNNQYENTPKDPDVCLLRDIPPGLSASRVMFVRPPESKYDDGVKFMIQDSFWNGVTHVDAKWTGNVLEAIEGAKRRFKNYNPEYVEKVMPKDDWICVTVDYHN